MLPVHPCRKTKIISLHLVVQMLPRLLLTNSSHAADSAWLRRSLTFVATTEKMYRQPRRGGTFTPSIQDASFMIFHTAPPTLQEQNRLVCSLKSKPFSAICRYHGCTGTVDIRPHGPDIFPGSAATTKSSMPQITDYKAAGNFMVDKALVILYGPRFVNCSVGSIISLTVKRSLAFLI